LKNEQSHTEQQLVSLLRTGSQFAFEKLFEKYSQKLFRFSFSYLKSDADSEEIVQNVFLKIWENRQNLRDETSFKSYLFTIAFNVIRKNFNQKAKENKYKTKLLEVLASENPMLETNSDFEVYVLRLEQLIEQMPDRRKEIFLKRKKEGKSVREIASSMDISPKTVENQITEAMNYLKKEFGQDQISGMLFLFIFAGMEDV
jgi:RNA polymerase sigma-70 factor (ECF subfamily)